MAGVVRVELFVPQAVTGCRVRVKWQDVAVFVSLLESAQQQELQRAIRVQPPYPCFSFGHWSRLDLGVCPALQVI